MQPGTKTLAPTDIRRDPRKPPSFCEHFKHIKRMRSISDTPSNDLMIRGIEITQEPVQPTVECPSEVTNTENLNLNIELTECCHCLDDKHLSDRLNIEQILQDECKVKIFEKPLENGKPKHLEVVRRSEVKEPSPRTVQVISVKLNTRKLEEESEVSDEIRA
ncbi:unnamed protein product [Hermetia illucens]|uniref:Uncharacterized protein n=2 Tax=Hermetia illucens TaxID=343691 RepID=A0A7R8UVR1_HERIL|nr:unnamed protein product [Hermetia illucens]